MEVLNKKAHFDYFIEEEYECGIVLTGTEIKSIREGSCVIKDSYGIIKNNELFILNMFIKKYVSSGTFAAEETRTRKLLMHKNEILKLTKKIEQEGYTLIPLKLYFKNNKAKILLGLCKGKKQYDKRNTLKEKDIKLNIAKELKNKINK